jgi:GPH family glycoside/pentoside/hexuronide:cation symporter
MRKKHQGVSAGHVSLGTRIGWGFGGLADNYIMNVLNMIFLVLYVQYFKMPPMLAATALAIPRFMDAITDPLVGNISDNTRSRWGRRRPYLVWGAVLSAILLPLFWVPPGEATATVWWQNPAFIYAVVLGTVYAITYTLFVVPYTALGYELTPDYDEKTRVLAWRMYIGLLGSLTVPWVYQLAQNDAFASEGSGAFWVSVGCGLIIIVTGIIPALVCREREDVQKQATSPFFKSLGATMTNKPFMILLVAYIIIIVGLFSAGNLGAFVNIYYICGGNKDFGGLLVAVSGSLGAIVSYLSMFLVTAVSTRTGKKTGMFLGLALALLGVVGAWWAMDPRWPMAQLITTVVACMGLQGCWLMVSSMVADVCDEDELKTGLRREGMFGAVNGFALKAALSVTAMIGGILLTITGFNAEAIDQFEARTIAQVIEPARELQITTPEFERAGERFIEIAHDQSSMSGSKWTVLWRLLKGEKAFFRWYDFENALAEFLRTLPADRPEIAAYVAGVEQSFTVEFNEQKRIALLMKKLIVGCQAVGLAAAMVVFAFYPITRKRAENTRHLLDERHRNA